ncbi:MAG: IS630 family transposase [Bacteroidota bacterium]
MRYVRSLSDEEVGKLEVMRRNEVGRVSQRAHVILLSNRHYCVAEIARTFDATQGSVRRWLERSENEGIDCLVDKPRSGGPPKVSAAALPLIERDVLTSPASKGYLFSIWTTINLSVHLITQYGIRVDQATIRRILVALDFRHNRPRHGPRKAVDPQLKKKLNAILGVLSSRVPGNHVLYEDEADTHLLPVIRAMSMKKGEQVRVPTPGTNSKKTIFGALDIRTGRRLHRISDCKRTEQFIEFLNYVTDFYPTGKIHIILGNYSIHKGQAMQEWLTSHPRVGLYYSPCYMPQLNPVEKIWWRLKAVVAANRLHGTLDALIDAVETFFKLLTASEALTLPA